MKVVHLISGGDSGGAKTHVFTLLEALTEDIDTRIICFTEGVFYQEIQELDIPSMLIKQKYRNDLTIIKPLVKHIREEGYHLIHAHGARANFIAMFIRPFIKIPIITTVHSDYKLDFTENLYKKYFYTGLNIMALKQIDYYIAVSENFRQMLIDRDFPKDDIYTVYNAIDFDKEINYIEKDEFLNRYGIDSQGKTFVGIVGRFEYVKGHDIFINGAAEILKDRKDVYFLLAGDGPDREKLENQAKELGIKDHIIFLGFVTDIYSFYNAIDINVLASRSESFPYALLEGARMKKATVSSKVGGISDLILEGETGYLAEAKNPQELAEKIKLLIDNPDLRKELGDNLNEYARTNFSKDSMKNRHIAIYEDVLKRRKAEDRLFDVALFGYYGYDNSGDDALLKSVINSLRREKEDIKILVLSKKPKETMKEYNVHSIYRYNIFDIMKYFKISRVLIYGGGSLIQDLTSTRSLVVYTTLLKIGKKYGLKTMLYGNGIGPITKDRNRERAREVLDKCDYISLRDPDSLEEIRKLGVTNPNINISVDPVFSLEKDNGDIIKEIIKKEKIDINKKYFIVSLRQWKYNEADFSKKMARIINTIVDKYDIYPLYMPMHPSDNVIIKEIINKAKTEYVLIDTEYEVSQLMGIASLAEFSLCMRLHALIYSVSVKVPVIGLVYDPKVESFIEYIDEKSYVYTSNLDVDKTLGMVDYIVNNQEYMSKRMEEEAERLKALADEDAKMAIELIDK